MIVMIEEMEETDIVIEEEEEMIQGIDIVIEEEEIEAIAVQVVTQGIENIVAEEIEGTQEIEEETHQETEEIKREIEVTQEIEEIEEAIPQKTQKIEVCHQETEIGIKEERDLDQVPIQDTIDQSHIPPVAEIATKTDRT